MSLGLVMIVRDAAAGVERALASARDYVDDMVVLDTGSTDDTVARAQAAGARVFHFTWIDDFSAARNAALSHCTTDWQLVLDADEWLSSGTQALRAVAQRPADFVGMLMVDSAFDNCGAIQTSATWLPRLLPRGTRYAGRVHEHPQSKLPRQRLPVVIGHDGYRDAALQAKDGRNLRLLLRSLQDTPDDPYLLYQLGRDHEVHSRFDDAVLPYRRALQRAPLDAAWRHDLVVRTLFTLKRVGLHGEGVRLAECEAARWPDSPDFFFAVGDLLLDWAACEPERAHDLVPMMEAAWQCCLNIGENPIYEGAVPGRGSHLAQHNLDLLHRLLGRQAVAASGV